MKRGKVKEGKGKRKEKEGRKGIGAPKGGGFGASGPPPPRNLARGVRGSASLLSTLRIL